VSRRRVLAIDPGKARLGLAVSDPDRKIPSPLVNYTRKDPQQDAQVLRQIIEEEEIGLIVIGLPVHLDGREGEQAQKARAFGKWLHEQTGMACVYFDERFSTHEAEAVLRSAGLTQKKRKARRDQVAAQVLLHAFLEAGCPVDHCPGPLG
jgi:putative holliday junction resolvase